MLALRRKYFKRAKDIETTVTSLLEALNVANGHLLSGNASLAESITNKVLEAYPNNPSCLQLLGVIYTATGDFTGAIDFFTKAIATGNASAANYSNLGSVLRKVGRFDEAISAFNKAHSIDPNFVAVHFNLGNLYRGTGKIKDAIAWYKAGLKLEPDNIKGATIFRIMTDENPGSPPDEYIALINNENALFFEQMMKNSDSQIPQLVRAAADQMIMEHESNLVPPISNVLDLGCGTGRSGVEFRNISNILEGVDLSSGMMTKAREKGVYDTLFLDNFIHFMAQKKDAYDLVLAVDSLIYTGPLEAIFDSVDSVLRKRGAFTFTVEYLDTGDFAVQQQTSRHAHGEGYIRNLAVERGFNVLLCQPINRMRGEVNGTLFWLEKSG
jgi:predicted TPR repeat methyltransferase